MAGSRNRLLVAENVTFFVGGSENTLIHWWLRKGGLKIGGWVEVDWWLQNFCSAHHLRVEFLVKADSGYTKDTGDTLCTLATPGNPIRHNNPR